MNNANNFIKEKMTEIRKNPVVILSLTYPLILVIGIGIGLYYATNLDKISRQSVRPVLPDSTIQQQLKIVEAKTIPPLDIKQAAQPTQEIISQGESIYGTVCASCHGEGGEGNGPASTGLNPAPRNFTNADGWKNGIKISGIYKTLEEGIPGTAMISYDYLLPAEKIGLAHYIRSSFLTNPPLDTPDDLTTLDQTYNLSQGKEVAAQIPVEDAMNIIVEENKAKVNELSALLSAISNDREDNGSGIFSRISNNKIQALSALKTSADWKGNPDRFTSLIYSNVNENVFNNNVRNLSDEEWNELYNYLSRYF